METYQFGFDTGIKKWFMTTHYPSGFQKAINVIKKCKINLINVKVGTYAWTDSQNPQATHGRLEAFVRENKVDMKMEDGEVTDITIIGKQPWKFKKFTCKTVEFVYDIPTKGWLLKIDTEDGKQELQTRTYHGHLTTDNFSDNPIRFFIENVELLWSWDVTLIDPPLNIMKDAPVPVPKNIV
tara:strand:- start:490 stop:1035 length:546 start_codon:yes stop_codon:yes gene_type:complete